MATSTVLADQAETRSEGDWVWCTWESMPCLPLALLSTVPFAFGFSWRSPNRSKP